MKKHIPNLLTCLNLFSGCIGALDGWIVKIKNQKSQFKRQWVTAFLFDYFIAFIGLITICRCSFDNSILCLTISNYQ